MIKSGPYHIVKKLILSCGVQKKYEMKTKQYHINSYWKGPESIMLIGDYSRSLSPRYDTFMEVNPQLVVIKFSILRKILTAKS
jgi:hypothetical protein